MRGVEFRGSDDFRQFFHIYRFDVNDIYLMNDQTRHDKKSGRETRNILKLWSLMLRFQRLIRRSSAEMYVS